MRFWTEFKPDFEKNLIFDKKGKNKYSNLIFTFDIETTSYIVSPKGEILNASKYETFTEKEREEIKARCFYV